MDEDRLDPEARAEWAKIMNLRRVGLIFLGVYVIGTLAGTFAILAIGQSTLIDVAWELGPILLPASLGIGLPYFLYWQQRTKFLKKHD